MQGGGLDREIGGGLNRAFTVLLYVTEVISAFLGERLHGETSFAEIC